MGKYLKRDKVQIEREKLFHEFASGVTLHGFRFMFDDKHLIRRVIWFVLLSSVFALSIILFYEIVVDYVQFKTVTVVTKENNLAEVIGFPTITVCPFNSKSETKLKHTLAFLNMTDGFIDMMDGLEAKDIFSDSRMKPLIVQLLKSNMNMNKLMALYEFNYYDWTSGEIVSTISNPPCQFFGNACTEKDFKKVRTWHTKNDCIQFNGFNKTKGAIKPLLNSEESRGLKLVMDLHNDDEFSPNLNLQGAIVTFSSYGYPYKVIQRTKAVNLSPGQMTFMKLTTKKTISIPKPFGMDAGHGCGTGKYKVISETYPYSQVMCWIDCILAFVFEKCGCLGVEMTDEVPIDTRMCGVAGYECYLSAKENYTLTKRNICWSSCRRECKEVSYEIEVSTASLGNRKIFKQLSNLKWNKTEAEAIDYVRKNMVGIDVSFQDYSVFIEESTRAVSWTDLASSIGGSIGLCLGFSLVTAYEFIFFLYDYLMVPLRFARRKELKDVNNVTRIAVVGVSCPDKCEVNIDVNS